jgi:polyhydroxyalkanoate synthesis repressor PhaR
MKRQDSDGVVTVKKYANRRLYNTETSSYITLDHLAAMTREGREFRVVDARTDEDITHAVLTQIIMEEEGRDGQAMLPVGFLRELIALYGQSVQAMVPGYLEASMDSFRRNQAQLQSGFTSAVEGAFAGSPFAEIARRNMAMFQAAAGAFKPGGTAAAATTGAPAPTSAQDDGAAGKDAEIAALKAELASLHAKMAGTAG